MLKPIDIHNAEFKRSFKGYNEAEVDAFIAKVVIEYERIYNEHKQLQEQVKELQSQQASNSAREQDIYDLITLTKESVAEAKELSQKQASSIVAEAEAEAARIIAKAERELEEKQLQVNKLDRKEQAFKGKMRQLMETFWAMLEPEVNTDDQDIQATRVYKDVASGLDQD